MYKKKTTQKKIRQKRNTKRNKHKMKFRKTHKKMRSGGICQSEENCDSKSNNEVNLINESEYISNENENKAHKNVYETQEPIKIEIEIEGTTINGEKFEVIKNKNIYEEITRVIANYFKKEIEYIFIPNIEFGGMPVSRDDSTFENIGAEDGARFGIDIVKATFKGVINDILELHKGEKTENGKVYNLENMEEQLKNGLHYGKINEENPSHITGGLYWGGNILWSNKLLKLPDSICDLKIDENFQLSENKLNTLPDRFSDIEIGGNLMLDSNPLISLPKTFGEIKVGKKISLLNIDNNILNNIDDLQDINNKFVLKKNTRMQPQRHHLKYLK